MSVRAAKDGGEVFVFFWFFGFFWFLGFGFLAFGFGSLFCVVPGWLMPV
jgi:hypothetical protein